MDDEVLKMMCDYLRPVRYLENNIIFQSGDQMDRMLLIIEGTLLTYSTSPDPSLTHGGETTKYSGSTAIKQVVKGEVYGEELLTWASGSPSESGQFNLPTCPENVRCHTNVEGFALLAMDLTSVASKCKRQWRLRKYFQENGGEHLKEKQGDKVRIFTESEIKEATNNYAKRNEIGSGRHGIVYRGTSVASIYRRRWRLRQKYFKENGGERLKEKLGDRATIFTESEIKEATNNYAVKKEIGRGRYGIVYRGVLDSKDVAIKKSRASAPIDDQNQSTDTAPTAQKQSTAAPTDQNQNTAAQTDQKETTPQDQFVNEMTVLYQINHNNVVRFVGCCLETKPPILVYKFIRNGSLHTRIHGKEGENPQPPLPLATRLKIAAETAGALAYLHHDGLNKIIHGDVKTANILLDEDLTPKLSDFGASRLLVPEDENQKSTLVHESVGYVDPEYLDSKKPLTEKSDVYSFGVVLAELLTGRKAEENLANDFVDSVEKDMLDQILDGKIVEEHLDKEVRKAADLAKRCLKSRGEERPFMKQVAPELQLLVLTMTHRRLG